MSCWHTCLKGPCCRSYRTTHYTTILPSIVCIVNICTSAAVVSWYWHSEKDQPELKMSAIARPQLTSEPAYMALQDYFNKNGSSLIMRDMFKADPNRFSKFRLVKSGTVSSWPWLLARQQVLYYQLYSNWTWIPESKSKRKYLCIANKSSS